MSFLFTEAHQDDVCGEAVKPGGESRLAAESVNLAEELEEGLLREIFGFEGVADHAEAETVNATRMLAVEIFEGGGVTTLGAADGCVELGADWLQRAHWRVGELFHRVALGAGAKVGFNNAIVSLRR